MWAKRSTCWYVQNFQKPFSTWKRFPMMHGLLAPSISSLVKQHNAPTLIVYKNVACGNMELWMMFIRRYVSWSLTWWPQKSARSAPAPPPSQTGKERVPPRSKRRHESGPGRGAGPESPTHTASLGGRTQGDLESWNFLQCQLKHLHILRGRERETLCLRSTKSILGREARPTWFRWRDSGRLWCSCTVLFTSIDRDCR